LPAHTLPALTISRETGAGGITIAQLIADYLRTKQIAGEAPWTVFDRNLVAEVIEEHKLPKTANQYMQEDRRPAISDAVESLLGLHPGNWTLTEHTSHTILHLARFGHVILVGRGANFIAANLSHVFNVRLTAPLEDRARHVAEYYRLTKGAAAEFVRVKDRGRARYVRQHFSARISDPLAYDLTINTKRITFQEAAQLIGQAVLSRQARSDDGMTI